jgi:hypothetical protein
MSQKYHEEERYRTSEPQEAVLGICDVLVRTRIRIPGSVPLTNESGSDSFLP